MKKILLISFKYPPYSGVGANRWAKLTQYLAQNGYIVHVVTVKWKYNKTNKYININKHRNIHIHRISSGYYQNLKDIKINNRYLNIIKRELLYFFDKILYFDDEAQRWNYYLLPYCEKLIKNENIKTVIATGHPFQANRWAAELKLRIPNIFLIQDFRDPWLHPYKEVFNEINRKRIKRWIHFSLARADRCVFVTKGLGEYVLDGLNIPFKVITNGHDFKNADYEKKKRNQWIFAGNLSNGRDITAKFFLDVIMNNPGLLHNNTIKFYGHFPEEFFVLYSDIFKKGLVQYCGIVSQDRIYEELIRSKVALHFGSEMFPFALSTKIFEYAAARVPTLAISYGGEIDTLIQENNWGLIARPDRQEIECAITEIQNMKNNITDSSVNKYHFNSIAMQYSDIIKI